MSLPRGLRDIEPEEYEVFEFIRETFKEVTRIFNFKLMEPSTIEFLTTLEAKSGEAIKNEIYHFKDKSGREIALRFDLTVGLTRYVTQRRELPIPVKVGSFGGMWRYDEPQFARYRWFHQWDVEIFDDKNPYYDAEIINFAYTLFKKLGLKVKIEIGDRRIIEEYLLKHLKIEDYDKRINMMRALDKASKKEFEEIQREYQDKGIDGELLKNLFNFANLKGNKVLKNLEEYKLETKNIAHLVDLLKDMGVDFELNLGIVRGLDYYNGFVFEIFNENNKDLGALAGGGRYDILPQIFGREDLGATGVAGGIERTVLALKRENFKIPYSFKRVFIAYLPPLNKEAFKICSELRKNSISCEVLPFEKSLKKQLAYANKFNFDYSIILVPKEFSEGKILVKDMKKGEEKLLNLVNLLDFLS